MILGAGNGAGSRKQIPGAGASKQDPAPKPCSWKQYLYCALCTILYINRVIFFFNFTGTII